MNAKIKSILVFSVITTIIIVGLFFVSTQNAKSTNDNLPENLRSVRIACMGDSITNETSYPQDLQALVGSSSLVSNFGYNGAAVSFYSDRTYYFSDSYRDARSFQPTIAIIFLGTNDARTNLEGVIGNFTMNYEHMIQRMLNGTRSFSGNPQIYLVIPPPIFANNLNLTSTFFEQEIIPRIYQVANDYGLPVIDVYTPLVNHPEYFSDGVHPNAEGSQIIANTIYKAIVG